MTWTSGAGGIAGLIGRARGRFLGNEILAQSAYAASVAMGGAVVLLLLGSQILDWRWIAFLSAVSLAVGLYRVARRTPSFYRVAQIVDRRLALDDSLSTALYFSDPAQSGRVSELVRQAQLDEAERLSAGVDLRRAIPFTLPRAIYLLAGLGLVASSLFALRYGIERRIDLKPSLARMLFDTGPEPTEQTASLHNKQNRPKRPPDLGQTAAIPVQDGDQQNSGKLQDLEAAPDSVLDTVDTPDVNNDRAGNQPAAAKSKSKASEPDSAEGEQAEGDSTDNAEQGSTGENTSKGLPSDQRAGKQGDQSASNPGSDSSSEDSSVMSKLREAMSNLLSRMRQPTTTASSQQASNSRASKSPTAQQPSPGQPGAAGQGRQDSKGQEGSETKEGESGEDSENGQGKGGGKNSDQQATRSPGSGMGKQDGSKDVKQAEQLAAMGKISEIIGKRIANVTGEMTIEVQSSKQQLRTPYSQKSAVHTSAGGEINRDEVPVVFQHYVQQYFEQVRKQEEKAQKPAVKAPSAP